MRNVGGMEEVAIDSLTCRKYENLVMANDEALAHLDRLDNSQS